MVARKISGPSRYSKYSRYSGMVLVLHKLGVIDRKAWHFLKAYMWWG